MSTTANENLIDWLRDAHAMEQQAEAMLEAQASRLEHYPDLRQRIVEHIKETQWQRAELEGCLTRLGSSPSMIKDMGGKLMAFGQGVGGMMNSDEVIKGGMAGYVFENLEIATYTVLITAAGVVGDTQTKAVCEAIIKQEQAMAAWLLQHLPTTTTSFLVRDATPGVEAKV
jgi:ferritin-like metal-binding protein YciE